MARTKWTKQKANPDNINSGNEYTIDDQVAIETLNAIVNNSFYASDNADSAKSTAEQALAQVVQKQGTVVNVNEVAQATVNFESDPQTQINTINTSLSNPNLLINGDFKVNQRGATSYTSGYSVDRWTIDRGTLTPNTSGSVTIVNSSSEMAYFQQRIEETSSLWGKTITASIKLSTGTILKATTTLPSTAPSASQNFVWSGRKEGVELRLYYFSSGFLSFTVDIWAGTTVTIMWAKMEIGSFQTEFSPRPYAEELVMCQRYYNSVFANGCSQIYQGSIYFTKDLPTTMRVSPSLTMIGECYTYTYDGKYVGVGTVTINSMRGSSISLRVTNSAFTNNVVISTGVFSIKLDAEIY